MTWSYFGGIDYNTDDRNKTLVLLENNQPQGGYSDCSSHYT